MCMDKTHRPGFLRGAGLLALTLVAAALLPESVRLELFALVLALTAGIYLGFAWLDARRTWVVVETIVALLLLVVALWGLRREPLLIALAFLLHVAWDLAHHPRGIRTRVAGWVPPACVVYDVGVAVAMLIWWWPV